MIELVFEVIVSILWDGLVQLIWELLALGAAVGLALSLAFPRPFFRYNVMPGASLILSPLFNGAVMEYYGRWSERRTGARTHLATFWGGALFAFGMALVRFLMIEER
jgi:hypothetical protein